MTDNMMWILSGEPGAGKSTLCGVIAAMGQEAGYQVRGVRSPAVYRASRKVGINAINLENNRSRPLAKDRENHSTGLMTDHWAFNMDTIRWGNRVLDDAVPCDVLILDELGPLELERECGWEAGLRALDGGQFQAAVVVVRPRLLELAMARWPSAQPVHIHGCDDLERLARQFFSKLFPDATPF